MGRGINFNGDMSENRDIVEIPTSKQIVDLFRRELLPVAIDVYLKLMSSQDDKVKKDAADKVVDVSLEGEMKKSKGGEGGSGGTISLPLDKIKGALVGLKMVDDGEERNPNERLAKPWDTESFTQNHGKGTVQADQEEKE